MKYLFADGHIFKTVNGEGAMLGITNIFFRLAGCSVACKGCDTRYNYDKTELSKGEIFARLSTDENKNVEWVWITGGEPTDQDVAHLIKELKKYGATQKFALATSGVRDVSGIPFDFISVSPHGKPSDLLVHEGDQINLVPSLGGLKLSDWGTYNFSGYQHKFITPSYSGGSLQECRQWVDSTPGLRLGVQAHKVWGIK